MPATLRNSYIKNYSYSAKVKYMSKLIRSLFWYRWEAGKTKHRDETSPRLHHVHDSYVETNTGIVADAAVNGFLPNLKTCGIP